MRKIHDFLRSLDFSESEASIYEKLLEMRKTSITELARALSMNRVTAHFNIQSLINKGLITQIKKGRSRELTAQSPDSLRYLIEQKQRHLKSLHESFESLQPIMNTLHSTPSRVGNQFNAKFFSGENAVRMVYRDVLNSKEVRSYVNVKNIYEVCPENAQLFSDAVNKKQITMWEIIEDSPASRADVKIQDSSHYFYRFLPSTWNQTLFFDYMIFNERIAIVTVDEQNKPLGVIIKNKNVYEHSKHIFEMIWSILPEPKNEPKQ